MPRKATNRALVVHAAACLEIVLGTEASLVVRFVQANVDPIVVLLVPCFVGVAGALLQQMYAEAKDDHLEGVSLLSASLATGVKQVPVCVCVYYCSTYSQCVCVYYSVLCTLLQAAGHECFFVPKEIATLHHGIRNVRDRTLPKSAKTPTHLNVRDAVGAAAYLMRLLPQESTRRSHHIRRAPAMETEAQAWPYEVPLPAPRPHHRDTRGHEGGTRGTDMSFVDPDLSIRFQSIQPCALGLWTGVPCRAVAPTCMLLHTHHAQEAYACRSFRAVCITAYDPVSLISPVEFADLGVGTGTHSSASVASTASIDSANGWVESKSGVGGRKENMNTPGGPPEVADSGTPRSVGGRSFSSSSLTDSSAGSLDGEEITDDTFMQLVMTNGTEAVPAESTCVNGRDLAAIEFDLDDAARLKLLFHTGSTVELHR